MIHAIIRHGARLLAGAAFVACVGSAHGAGITLSDSNCDSFSLTGSPGNQTLSCVVSNAPSCTISGPSTGSLGSAVTLTAVCSSSPTSWRWTSSGQTLNCGSTPSCSDTQTVAGVVTYTVTAVNAIATGSSSQTVTWSAQQVAAPSGCAIAVSPSAALTTPGIVTLNMSCSGGGAPTSFSWAGGFAAGAVSASVSGTVTATTSFTATATNAGGSAQATQSVSLNTPTDGGGNGTCCPGFTNTRLLTMDWNNPQPLLTNSLGGVGPNDAVVVKFTTGSNVNPNQYGNITGAEYTSDPSTRQGVLSTSMCDFGGTLGFGATSTSNTVTINFSVGANGSGYYPALQPNTTYYYNVKQVPGSTCAASGNCAMYFQMHKPPGL